MNTKRYGFFTAVSMVVGSVIGSGIFFKAETIVKLTGGNLFFGALTWIIGGVVMLLCLLSFSLISSVYGSEGGITGLSRSLLGSKFGSCAGWFMATIYYPSLTAALGWLSARYILILSGADSLGIGLHMLLSCVIVVISFAHNVLSPTFSGKFQVVTAIIKLIPLFMMAVCGIASGFKDGNFAENLFESSKTHQGLFGAVSSSLFAYEGWIVASSIGKEMKKPKKMTSAMIVGAIVIILTYVTYYTGITMCIKPEILINYGAEGVYMAFESVFGRRMGIVLTAFIAVSCLGALNGMIMGTGRGLYEISTIERSNCFKIFSEINPVCKMPVASFVAGFIFSFIWLFFIFVSNLRSFRLLAPFGFDTTQMPVVSLYLFYIPIFIAFIKKHGRKKINVFLPAAGICSCVFVFICAVLSNYKDIVSYICTFTAVMLLGEAISHEGSKEP